MLGHMEDRRPFRPVATPGGSKKGKAQRPWPLFLRVVADAVVIRHKGTIDACLADRRFISGATFRAGLESLLPGFGEYMSSRGPTAYALLKNRVYKMYYSGTSDRGRGHDPRTRAAVSKEHWRNHVAPEDPLAKLHDDILRGNRVRIDDWRQRL